MHANAPETSVFARAVVRDCVRDNRADCRLHLLSLWPLSCWACPVRRRGRGKAKGYRILELFLIDVSDKRLR